MTKCVNLFADVPAVEFDRFKANVAPCLNIFTIMARKTFTLKQVLDEVLLNSDSDYDPELEDSSSDESETEAEVSLHTQQSVTSVQPLCSNSRQSRKGRRGGGCDSSFTPEKWWSNGSSLCAIFW